MSDANIDQLITNLNKPDFIKIVWCRLHVQTSKDIIEQTVWKKNK